MVHFHGAIVLFYAMFNECTETGSSDEYCHKGVKNHKKQCGVLVVKVVSSLLPHIEQIGHRILSVNNHLIQQIMDMDESKLSHKDKGRIITSLIHIAQWGDNAGSRMLQMYLDIVESSFHDENE